MEIFWNHFPLIYESQRLARIASKEADLALQPKNNVTGWFHKELKARAVSNQNLIMYWWTFQGGGKSFSMMDTAQRFLSYRVPPKELTVDYCYFTVAEMLMDIRKKFRKGDIGLLDEQVKGVGVGSGAERWALENIEEIVRQQELSFFYSAPREVPHAYHFKMQPWYIGTLEPVSWEQPIEEITNELQRKWKFTQCIIYDRRGRALGHVITTTPSDEDGFLSAYEKKKAIFIKRTSELKGSPRHYILEAVAEDLLKNEEFVKRFVRAKSKDLRKVFIQKYGDAPYMTGDMEKRLVAYLEDLYLEESPELLEKFGTPTWKKKEKTKKSKK